MEIAGPGGSGICEGQSTPAKGNGIFLLEKCLIGVLVHASILLSMATMKVPKTFEDLCKKRAAQRRRDMADLRSGRATAEEIWRRNSWFSRDQVMRIDLKKFGDVL